MARQLYLAAYDIADPKRMAHARDRIRAYATGGQKSVFECLVTPGECRLLLEEMRSIQIAATWRRHEQRGECCLLCVELGSLVQ